MFKKKPILQYKSVLKEYPNTITPAKNHIPNWYKKIPKWKDNEIFEVGKGFNSSIKQCVPFLGSLTTGYVITLPYDLYVKNDGGFPLLTWKSLDFPPKVREEVADPLMVPAGHAPIEFLWNYCVYYRFPKGYSALFTHPLNRFDLPFTTVSGVLDGDFTMYAHGNAPFYIKKDFEGIIPQGTPIAQLIPFLQESWKSEVVEDLDQVGDLHKKSCELVISGYYKKNFWKRKNYE